MRRHLPVGVSEAQKQGFSGPDSSWFKGESIDFVKRKLINQHAKIYEFLDKDVVTKMVNQHLDGTQNRRLLVWSLLNFEESLEQGLC